MSAEDVVRAVERRFGLRFQPGLRSQLAESAAELVAAGAAQDLADVATRVGNAAEDDPVVQRMRTAASVCETYFFRAPDQLRALREMVVRCILPARSERKLRIWSAGCATGEEAWTLAALFLDVTPPLQLEVVGTDMNEVALQVAEAGRYGRRSFRRTRPDDHARWFEEKDGQYRVRDELRRLVSFARLNLATDALPANLTGFDVVVCRNVLIYVEPDRIARAVRSLAAAAASPAVLALAPAEYAAARYADGFHAARAALFLRGAAVPARASGEVIAADLPRPRRAAAEPDHDEPASPVVRPSPEPPARPLPALPRIAAADACARARAAADLGDYEAAERTLEEAIHSDPTSAHAYYLLGSVHVARGAPAEAIEQLRRALFLAPDLIAAHLALGQALERAGRFQEARRHLRAALRCLGARGPGELIDELGVAAASAARIAEDALARLEERT
jgi:chemotaxis protein methyltransferase CheR